MSINKLLLILTFQSVQFLAQTPSLVDVDVFPTKNSLSMQDYGCYDKCFKNFLVVYLKHGATVFNTKEDLLLVDRNTFEEKSKMTYPRIKGYDAIQIEGKYYEELNGNLVFFSKKKDPKTGRTNLCAFKITESFFEPTTAEPLFPMLDDENSLRCDVNAKKDLILFTDKLENEKKDRKLIHFRLYDANLNLLMHDSITSSFEQELNSHGMLLDEQVAFILHKGQKTGVVLYDHLTNKSLQIALPENSKNPNITNFRKIDNQIIFCGNYFSKNEKKKYSNGIFKFVYNLTTKSMEKEDYFEHEAQGKDENESYPKRVNASYIGEDGSVFVLISQTWSSYTGGSRFAAVNMRGPDEYKAYDKYEVMGINSRHQKWRKQLPVSGIEDVCYLKNTMFISCISNNTYDFNNFIYENPLTKGNVYALHANTFSSTLKVSNTGSIDRYGPVFSDNNTLVTEPKKWRSRESYDGALKTREMAFSKTITTE